MKRITGIFVLILALAINSNAQDTIRLESGLKFMTIKEGKGTEKPVSGNKAKVKYTAHYHDGKKYESGSIDFIVDKPEVIKAWDEAVKMMVKGQQVVIVAPAHLAYGSKGVKFDEDDEDYYVPPGETLIFYMTLLSFK